MTIEPSLHTVYLGLGSNLGTPLEALKTAIVHLETEHITVNRVAGFYHSPPLGPPDQPDYVNTVVELRTSCPPRLLLEYCQQIELNMGRVKTVIWGPRVIDLDILLYDNQSINEPDLVVPHPELHKRQFVLTPLVDLASHIMVPGLEKTVLELQAELIDAPAVHRIA